MRKWKKLSGDNKVIRSTVDNKKVKKKKGINKKEKSK